MNFERLLVFLVGLSMPFNNVAFIPNYSIALLVSTIYTLVMFPQMSKWRILGQYYGNFLWVIPLYIAILYVVNILNFCGYNTLLFPFPELLCFMFMSLLLIHGLRDRKALTICLYGMSFGGILMSIFFTLNIGVSFDEGMRLTMFEENSNALGIYMGLSAIVILETVILNDAFGIGKFRFLFIFAFIPIVSLLIATASRTAFLIFVLSIIIVVVYFSTKTKFKKIVFIVFCTGCSIYAINVLTESNALVVERLTLTIEEGNTSNRDAIVESLLPYVSVSPILGCGKTGYILISQKALNKVSVIGGKTFGYSPHNVILELLLYTGVIGLFLWLVFWTKLGKESWVLLKKKNFIMPVVLCIPLLACILSGQLLTAKWAYVIYAYIMTEYYNLEIENQHLEHEKNPSRN